MAEKEIDPVGFAEERAREIRLIEAAIEANRKKSMLFQRLPFYRRRRLRSHEKRMGKRKRPRKRDRHGLRTHVWYAKRFEMVKTWGTSIPLRRRLKSSKFIYKSQSRGFVFDESYKDVVVYSRPEQEVLGIDFSQEDAVQRIRRGNVVFEAIVSGRFLVVITSTLERVEPEVPLVECSRIDCCLSLIQADELFSGGVDGRTGRFAKVLGCTGGFEEAMADGSNMAICIRSLSKSESGKVLLKRSMVMTFWQDITNTGVVPVCVEELQRLALENEYAVYPFDYPTTRLYKDFEQAYVDPIRKKYERTPKSKKMDLDTSMMYIYTDSPVVLASFEVEKGHADRCALLFDEDNNMVGRVVRGGFCFTKGLCRGLCYVLCDVREGSEFYSKNLNSSSFNQIRITRILDDWSSSHSDDQGGSGYMS